MFKDKPVVFLLLVSPPVFPGSITERSRIVTKTCTSHRVTSIQTCPHTTSEEELLLFPKLVLLFVPKLVRNCYFVLKFVLPKLVLVFPPKLVFRVGVSETRVVTTTKSDAGIRSER